MEKNIELRISQAIRERVFPGCVVGIVYKNGKRLIIPGGHFTYENDVQEMENDSIFDIASLTKAIPTSSLALKLIEEGKLNIDDKAISFVPELQNSERENVLIRHLLTHTIDWGFRLSELKNNPPAEIMSALFSSEFKSPPGSKYFYSNATSILLGIIIERIYGEPLDILGEKIFFSPLKMDRTSFSLLKNLNKEDIVPTEIEDWRHGLVQGEVHDESAYALKRPVGSAGLFSSVPDLLTFMEIFLRGGELNGKRYFSEDTIRKIQVNYGKDVGESIGLGWELNQPWYMGEGKKRFGKTGFTGCSCVCDTNLGIALVILSNRVYPTRKENSSDINKFRKDVADIVFSA